MSNKYRELPKLPRQVNKSVNGLTNLRQFFEEELQITNKHLRMYATSVSIKEMQTITALRSMAVTKNT